MCILGGILFGGTTTAANFSVELKYAAIYFFVNILMPSHSDAVLTQCEDATRRALAINIEKCHATFSQQPTCY